MYYSSLGWPLPGSRSRAHPPAPDRSTASGTSRFYDADGQLVLKDPGQLRIAFDIDYNGTPDDPSDDIEVPDSFRIVRGSTGNSDLSDRDFCADLAEFTG
jgi:hypothetical protein